MNVRNQWVHFKIGDVYYPDPTQVLHQLHAHDLLQGRIVDRSDGGIQGEAFLVVEVDGMNQRVVVPVDRVVEDFCE